MDNDQEQLAKTAQSLKIGDLTENTDWMQIQEIGKFLSPKGNDRLHTVELIERNSQGENIPVTEFHCTNSIYSEWVKCLCETMWHTERKVLYDCYGNAYPMGKMCEYRCRIRYKVSP